VIAEQRRRAFQMIATATEGLATQHPDYLVGFVALGLMVVGGHGMKP
jgi:hypothetical protein